MSGFTRTPNYALYKPTPNSDNDAWGGHLNTNADILDTLLGPGGSAPFLPLSGGTVSGALAVGYQTLPLAGHTSISPYLFTTSALSGSIAGGGDVPLNQFSVNTDTLATPAAVDDLFISHNFGGGGMTGSRTGLVVAMTQTGAVTPIGTESNIEAMRSGVTLANSFGGAGLYANAKGQGTGYGSYVVINSGATNINGGSGMELDWQASAGSSYNEEIGALFTHLAGHAVSGTRTSVGLAFTDGVAGHGWQDAILQVGTRFTQEARWPLGPNSAVVRAEISQAGFSTDPPNCAFGDDFLLANFSKAAFRTRGYLVDGSGNVQIGNAWLTNSSGTLQINPMNSVQTGATVAAGGSGYYGNAYATDPYGGVWQLTVTGSAVTGVTMYRAGRYAGTTPPANPVPLTASRDNPGTGATINITWNTAGGSVAIQPNAGTTTVGGSLAVAGSLAPGNGINFTSGLAGSTTDLSKQIDFYANFGFSLTSGRLNIVTGDAVWFNSASVDIAKVDGNGIALNIGGVNWGTQIASSNTDVSKHINLYGGQYGICVTGSRLNYLSGGNHVFIFGTTDMATITSTGGLKLAQGLGLFNGTPVTAKPTVTGSKGANAALASLLTALASYGLLLDSST